MFEEICDRARYRASPSNVKADCYLMAGGLWTKGALKK